MGPSRIDIYHSPIPNGIITPDSMDKISLYTDGGSRNNPGEAAIGIVLKDKDKILRKLGKPIGIATNNEAEYTALIEGLKISLNEGAKEVECFVDSELVAKQLKGLYKIKEPRLQTLCIKVKELEKKFNEVTYTHIPRKENSIADSLVNKALDSKGTISE